MNNKVFAIICLLLAGLMFAPCYGQNRGRKKQKLPEVPKSALLPSVSKTHFEKNVNAYLDWVDSLVDAPANVRQYGVNPRRYKFMSPSVIRQKILEYRSLIQHPDFEEVMEQSRGWYYRIYNASLPLVKAADEIHSMRSVPSQQKYVAARSRMHQAMNAVLDISEKTKPEKLPRKELAAIIKRNQERRRIAWLKWYFADQKKKALEAKRAGKRDDKNEGKNKNDRSSRRQDRKRKESAR